MASSTDIQNKSKTATAPSGTLSATRGRLSEGLRAAQEGQRDRAGQNDSRVRLSQANVEDFKDRRRRRRVAVQPMYTRAIVRVLSKREEPLEGHVVNLSETGMVVEVDEKIGTNQPVIIEFCVAGLGRAKNDNWPMLAVAAEVVRMDDLEDFPMGPYKVAVRFVRIATMVQGQIARFVAMQPDAAGR